MEYRREIDGLRAVAVIPVILYHAGPFGFHGGFVGVDIFFVISGYLITSILISDISNGKFSITRFYERRVRRIIPALFVVLAVSIPVAYIVLLPGDMLDFSASVASVPLFVSNIIFWRTSGYFDTASEMKPLLHTWSLAVEEQYYLIFPLLLVALFKRGVRFATIAVAAISAFSLFLADWGSVSRPGPTYFLIVTRGWELGAGSLCAIIWPRLANRQFGNGMRGLLALAGFAAVILSTFLLTSKTPFPGRYALAPVLGAVMLILFATPDTAVGRLLASKPLVGVGLISYSAYLWHQPLFAFARHLSLVGAESEIAYLLLIAAVLMLSFASWKFVEAPFRRGVLKRSGLFVATAVGSGVFVLLGLWGYLSGGFLGRYPTEDRPLASLRGWDVGRYVDRRFDLLVGTPFEESLNRMKVLVVGDSFAKDLVNAVSESQASGHVQLSTWYIGHECGNLFVPQEVLSKDIGAEDAPFCRGKGLYESSDFRRLIAGADVIWFAASWQPWQTHYVAQSVERLRSVTSARIVIFGTKHLGSVDVKRFLRIPFEDRKELTFPSDVIVDQTNRDLASVAHPENFVNIQEVMCPAGLCAVFSDAGELLTHDGYHLTAAGARKLGGRLFKDGCALGAYAHCSSLNLDVPGSGVSRSSRQGA